MKRIYFILIPFLFLSACETKKEECPESICSTEFVSIGIKFKHVTGKPIVVTNFSSTIRRTGRQIAPYGIDTVYSKGNYSVATDAETQYLSDKEDIIDVSAINPTNGQKKTTEFVVAGGKCACHIRKISGPEEVIFD